MDLVQLFSNHVLISALSAWGLAQILKIPIHYLRTGKRDWSLLFRAGGMPYATADSHWGPEGHALVAERLSSEGGRRGLLSGARP